MFFATAPSSWSSAHHRPLSPLQTHPTNCSFRDSTTHFDVWFVPPLRSWYIRPALAIFLCCPCTPHICPTMIGSDRWTNVPKRICSGTIWLRLLNLRLYIEQHYSKVYVMSSSGIYERIWLIQTLNSLSLSLFYFKPTRIAIAFVTKVGTSTVWT